MFLRLFLPLFLSLLPVTAAIHCVGSGPDGVSCDNAYEATATGLQSALNAAVAGDTIYVQEGTYAGVFTFKTNASAANPITVISRKYNWLPCPNCRLTPSYLPLMPILQSNVVNAPALSGAPDSNGNPPAGWNFVGLGFMLGFTNDHQNSIVLTGGQGVNNWYISSPANAPDSITFDRVFIASRFTDSNYAFHHIMANGSNITVKNSFLWPLYGGGQEIHGVSTLTGPGPVNVQNNFISAMTIPVFSGGSAPDYVGGGPGQLTVTDNFIYRPWKWYPDKWNGSGYCSTVGVDGCYSTPNPYPQYYTSNLPAPNYGCVKNMGELKSVKGFSLWERNIHENNWMDGGGYCLGQWFGFALTMRQTNWPNAAAEGGGIYSNSWWMDRTYTPPGGCTGTFSPGGCVGSLTTTGTDFQWKSSMNTDYPTTQWIQPGSSICLIRYAQSIDSGYGDLWAYDCRRVATVSHLDVTGATWNTGTLEKPFTSDVTQPSTTTTESVSSSQLTIPVADTTGFGAYDVVKLDQEFALVCSVGAGVLNICPNPASGGTGRGFNNRGMSERKAIAHPSGVSVSKVIFWSWVQDPDGPIENVTIRNEIFRNVAGGINMLAKDRVGWAPEFNGTAAGRVSNFTMSNVLFQDTVPNWRHNYAWKLYPQEQVSINQPSLSGNDFLIEHVTFDWKTKPWNVIGFIGDGVPQKLHSKVQNMTIRNNILPDASCADGNCYALTYSGLGGNSWTNAQYFTAGTQVFTNNQFFSVSTSCSGGVTCTGNRSESASANIAYYPNSYKLLPSSPLSKGGSDGSDIGVNDDALPQIRNVQVSAGSQSALLEFDLIGPIQDVTNTQPCMLEVSASEALQSYIGVNGPAGLPYTTINALNPSYFHQPDQSSTNNPLLLPPVITDNHISWPIGQAAIVTGDDGIDHDLSLSPATTYYGRVMCYADTKHFSFTTSDPGLAQSAAVPMQLHPPSGAVTVKVEYGSTQSFGSVTTAALDGSGNATVSVPAVKGKHLYTRTTYLDADGGTVGKQVRRIWLK